MCYRINVEERTYERTEEIEVEGFDEVMEQGGAKIFYCKFMLCIIRNLPRLTLVFDIIFYRRS